MGSVSEKRREYMRNYMKNYSKTEAGKAARKRAYDNYRKKLKAELEELREYKKNRVKK